MLRKRWFSKKSQVRMFESIAVLLIFVFIVAIGMKFYTNMQMASLHDAERKFTELDSVKSSVILSNLPEISCSFEGISEYSCVDLYKVISWNSIMESNDIGFIDYYVPLLGYSEIFIERIYPSKVTWTIYNSSLESSYDYMRMPIVIYDAISKKNQLGILHVKTYYETN